MVTKVGMQHDFTSALQDLLELDYDAITAYEAAIERLENATYRDRLTDFKQDHIRHTEEITQLLKKHHKKAPDKASAKQWLAKGKVVLADMIGDKAILVAMLSNEEDTNTAYERMNVHEDKWLDAEDILANGLRDEKKHKAWIEKILHVKD